MISFTSAWGTLDLPSLRRTIFLLKKGPAVIAYITDLYHLMFAHGHVVIVQDGENANYTCNKLVQKMGFECELQ